MVAVAQSLAGRRVCAWCAEDLGVAPGLAAGEVTHGICAACQARVMAQIPAAPAPQLTFLAVRRHPAGGWTHAAPVDATKSTVRIYRGWWSTKRAAVAAARAEGWL